jgi:hypothetical protein
MNLVQDDHNDHRQRRIPPDYRQTFQRDSITVYHNSYERTLPVNFEQLSVTETGLEH